MNRKRRSVVAGIGATLLTTITDYLDFDGGGTDDGERTLYEATDEREAVPDPTIVGRTLPNPSLVWIDDEPVSPKRHEFSAEIYNAGAPGTVGMTLVWVDDQATAATARSESVTHRTAFFETNQHRRLSVRADAAREYSAYELRLWVREFGVEIENDGGAGRIEVSLLDGDRLVDVTELSVSPGETVSLSFDGEYADANPDELELEARPVS